MLNAVVSHEKMHYQLTIHASRSSHEREMAATQNMFRPSRPPTSNQINLPGLLVLDHFQCSRDTRSGKFEQLLHLSSSS
jgi:hypothetical protein